MPLENDDRGNIRLPKKVHKELREYVKQRADAGENPRPTMGSLIEEMWLAYQKKAFVTPLQNKMKRRLKALNTSLAEVIETGISTIELMADDDA